MRLIKSGPIRSFLVVLVLALLVGCATRGPAAMTASRMLYNEAVQQTERRELLLNLVRLRYNEPPEFLAVGSISTQFGFNAGVSIGAEIAVSGNQDPDLLIPGASVGFSESPTITFVPRQDKEFTRQLVAPVELDSIYLLVHYGWGIDRVLRVIAKGMNGLSNVIDREGVLAPSGDMGTFIQATLLMRKLERQGALTLDRALRRNELSAPIPIADVSPNDILSASKEGLSFDYVDEPPSYVLTRDDQRIVLRLAESATHSNDFQSLARLIRVDLSTTTYDIDPAVSFSDETISAPSTTLKVDTRSILGAMAFLSNSVAVPADHLTRAVVAESPEAANALRDILVVKASVDEPNASLTVPYKGYWFYVEDSNLESKRTLGLLSSLIRLEIAAGGSQNVPILTLPVGQ